MAGGDIDEIAVERCMQGTYPWRRLNYAERREVIAISLGKQWSVKHTAELTGAAVRTVNKARQRHYATNI